MYCSTSSSRWLPPGHNDISLNLFFKNYASAKGLFVLHIVIGTCFIYCIQRKLQTEFVLKAQENHNHWAWFYNMSFHFSRHTIIGIVFTYCNKSRWSRKGSFSHLESHALEIWICCFFCHLLARVIICKGKWFSYGFTCNRISTVC